jgi:endonuclease-3
MNKRAERARRDKADAIRLQLASLYPAPPVPLDHQDAFTLLVAVMLSAQTTDARVNLVTPALFAKAPDAARMAALPVEEILGFIRTCGLAPTKARNLSALARMLVERHAGEVPQDFAALEDLPGVGHKTASVVMAQAFGVPAFPVDTHIHRLATRWGLSDGSNVVKTEADLKAVFPREHWNPLHLQIIYFGREHCPALRHDPAQCPICSWAGVQRRQRKVAATTRGAITTRTTRHATKRGTGRE